MIGGDSDISRKDASYIALMQQYARFRTQARKTLQKSHRDLCDVEVKNVIVQLWDQLTTDERKCFSVDRGDCGKKSKKQPHVVGHYSGSALQPLCAADPKLPSALPAAQQKTNYKIDDIVTVPFKGYVQSHSEESTAALAYEGITDSLAAHRYWTKYALMGRIFDDSIVEKCPQLLTQSSLHNVRKFGANLNSVVENDEKTMKDELERHEAKKRKIERSSKAFESTLSSLSAGYGSGLRTFSKAL